MKLLNKRYLIGASILLAIACGGGNLSGPDGDSDQANAAVNGSYSLTTVNGAAKPATLINTPGLTVRLTNANFTINANNTYSTTLEYSVTEGSTTRPQTESCNGTYTKNENSFSFNEVSSANTGCGGTYKGTRDGGRRLTVGMPMNLDPKSNTEVIVQLVFELNPS